MRVLGFPETSDAPITAIDLGWKKVSRSTSRGWSGRPVTSSGLPGPGPVTIQNSYSLVSRGVDHDLAETLFREEMSLLAYSPLGGGVLTGKYLGGLPPPGSRTRAPSLQRRFSRRSRRDRPTGSPGRRVR